MDQFKWPRQTQYIVHVSSSTFSCHNIISISLLDLYHSGAIHRLKRIRVRIRIRIRIRMRIRIRTRNRTTIRVRISIGMGSAGICSSGHTRLST